MVFGVDANAVIANKEDWIQMLIQPAGANLHMRISTAACVFGCIFQKILHDLDQPFPAWSQVPSHAECGVLQLQTIALETRGGRAGCRAGKVQCQKRCGKKNEDRSQRAQFLE